MYSEVLEDLMEEIEENSEAGSCDDDKYGEGEEDRAEVYEEDKDEGAGDELIVEGESVDVDAEGETDPDYALSVVRSPASTKSTARPNIDAWRAACRPGPMTESAPSPSAQSIRSSMNHEALDSHIANSRAHLCQERGRFVLAESQFAGSSDEEDDDDDEEDDDDDEDDLIPSNCALSAVRDAIADVSRRFRHRPKVSNRATQTENHRLSQATEPR